MSFCRIKWICINNDLSFISKQVSRTLSPVCHFSFKQIPLQKGRARSSLWLLKKTNKKKEQCFYSATEPQCLHSSPVSFCILVKCFIMGTNRVLHLIFHIFGNILLIVFSPCVGG